MDGGLTYYLPKMLDETTNYEYIFTYKDNTLIDVTTTPLVRTFR